MHRRFALFALVAAASALGAAHEARAQMTPGTSAPAGGPTTPGGATGNGAGATPPAQAPVTVPVPTLPVYGAPYGIPSGPVVDPNAHLPSSSQPSNDTSRASDYFDFAKSETNPQTLHGDPNGPFSYGAQSFEPAAPAPLVHVVQRGDTLWDVCDRYFHNPWEWPKIWSYNPELQNPHWIFPGDQLRLVPRDVSVTAEAARAPGQPAPAPSGMARKAKVEPGTVFLRDQGYIDDKLEGVWGEIGGSPEDQLLLSEGDTVYMDMSRDHDVSVGQDLTVFRPIKGNLRGDAKGMLVAILGTVHIDKWDRDSRVARGTLIESLDVIERGAKVGPVGRRFDVVPPVRNETEVWAHVSASLYPYGGIL